VSLREVILKTIVIEYCTYGFAKSSLNVSTFSRFLLLLYWAEHTNLFAFSFLSGSALVVLRLPPRQQKQLLRHRSPNPIPFSSLLHSVPIRMHSAMHAEIEHLLGTHSHICDLGLDSSLESHAVSDDMIGQITISLTPLIWASNLMTTLQIPMSGHVGH